MQIFQPDYLQLSFKRMNLQSSFTSKFFNVHFPGVLNAQILSDNFLSCCCLHCDYMGSPTQGLVPTSLAHIPWTEGFGGPHCSIVRLQWLQEITYTRLSYYIGNTFLILFHFSQEILCMTEQKRKKERIRLKGKLQHQQLHQELCRNTQMGEVQPGKERTKNF